MAFRSGEGTNKGARVEGSNRLKVGTVKVGQSKSLG